MKSTGWKIVDSGSETRIAEFTVVNSYDNVMAYAEAKAAALQRLNDHVAPYLARIKELEQGQFAETGALPPLKAWGYDRRHAVVTAKTKKRAIELAEETRYGFDSDWHECLGDWWYHLAHEEALWIEERDDRKQGTGVFYKPLAREEAKQILEPYISPYRTMDIHELLGQVDQISTVTGFSSQGTPYKVTTRIRRWDWDEDEDEDEGRIFVAAEINDCLGWNSSISLDVCRDLPELAVVGAEDWPKEGF